MYVTAGLTVFCFSSIEYFISILSIQKEGKSQIFETKLVCKSPVKLGQIAPHMGSIIFQGYLSIPILIYKFEISRFLSFISWMTFQFSLVHKNTICFKHIVFTNRPTYLSNRKNIARGRSKDGSARWPQFLYRIFIVGNTEHGYPIKRTGKVVGFKLQFNALVFYPANILYSTGIPRYTGDWHKIGRASCRERVLMSVGGES